MKNEVTKKESTEVAEFNNDAFEEAGSEQSRSSANVLIPKLILAQPGSPQVLAGDWTFGTLVSTLNDKAVASAANGKNEAVKLEFIPSHHQAFWIIKKENKGRFEFEEMFPVTPRNEGDDPYEKWKGPDGIDRIRIYLHLFYILIPGSSIPYTLGFRGGSRDGGKKLFTQMYSLNKEIKAPEKWKSSPFAKLMEVSVTKETKDNNTYAKLHVNPTRDATFEEACLALKLRNQIMAGERKADNSDIINEGKDTKQYADENAQF